MKIVKGDRFVWRGPCFIEVTRVARDQSWADIRVYTWARTWTKRQPLAGIEWTRHNWKMSDIQATRMISPLSTPSYVNPLTFH